MGTVITISRQLGAGGENIACRVAGQLGLRLLDQEIIHEAMQAGIPEDIAVESEEGKRSWVQRALDFLSLKQPAAITPGQLMESSHAVISTGFPKSEDYYRSILESIIFDIAQSGDVLLLGRAGQMIFQNSPNCFHVRIVAPPEKRIAALEKRRGISADQARQEIEESDRVRAAYLRRHYDADIDDARLYDLCLNTGTLPEQAAADLIVNAVHAVGLK